MKKIIPIIIFFTLSFTSCSNINLFESATSTAEYTTKRVPVVYFSPDGSDFAVSQNISIAATESPTNIYYRINVNGAWGLWQTYSGTFTVNQSSIVEAYAVNANGNGNTKTAAFSKTGEKPSVTLTPSGGAYQNSVEISIQATNNPTLIEYKINGGPWTTYSAPFTITSTSTISARASNGAKTSDTVGPVSYLIETYDAGEQNPIDFVGGFTLISGGISITDLSDGVYEISNSGVCIYDPTAGKTNYVVTGEIKSVSDDYGIIYRMQNSGLNGYGFQYESDRFRFPYFNDGHGCNDASMMLSSGTDLPNPTYNDPAGAYVANTADTDWHTFIIVVNGTELKIYFDGTLIFHVPDTTTNYFFTTSWWDSGVEQGIPPQFSSGGLGFRFWQGGTVVHARNWQYQEIN